MSNPPPPVLDNYREFLGTAATRQVEYLAGAGGFSGARFWRIVTQGASARSLVGEKGGVTEGRFCLRQWPQSHPTLERLTFIHAALRHAFENGFTEIPLPLPNRLGKSFVEHHSHFWELSPWLDGEADFARHPSEERLRAAANALARFHQAQRSFPGNHRGPSAALAERWRVLRRFAASDARLVARRLREDNTSPWLDDARAILDLFDRCVATVSAALRPLHHAETPVQPCIRDIWHDHVLFRDNEVSGFVDFGAMQWDHPSADAARLFGSLAGDRPEFWRMALHEYHRVAPIDEEFRRRAAIADQATVLLSGMNWLRWLYLDRRRFESRERVAARIRENRERLQHLAAGLRHPALDVP